MRIKTTLAALVLLIAFTFSAKANYYYDRSVQPEKGNGSKEKPFVISRWEHLLWISHAVNTGNSLEDKYFVQEGNLDLSETASWDDGEGWMPIGGYYTLGGTLTKLGFSGHYDGNGFVVKGLKIKRPEGIYQGLFGYISNGTIKNLKVEDASVSGKENIGTLAAYLFEAEVRGCQVSGGEVKASDFYVGGLVGYQSYGKISNCTAEATVTGKEYVGGLVGWTEEGSIEKCRTRGEVSTPLEEEAEHCGGLVGYLNRAKLKLCYSEAKVSGYQRIGGLIGLANKGTVESCYSHNEGEVSANFFVGGLVGVNEETAISDSYSRSSVSGKEEVGGFAGYISYSASKIINCHSAGKVTGENAEVTAGFAGSKGGGSIINCFWNSETSGQKKGVGGYDSGSVACKGLTTEGMKKEKSFEGWDFNKTWFCSAKYNDGFPHLQWFRDNDLGAIKMPALASPLVIILDGQVCTILANDPISNVLVFTITGEQVFHYIGTGEVSASFTLPYSTNYLVFQIRFTSKTDFHTQKVVRR